MSVSQLRTRQERVLDELAVEWVTPEGRRTRGRLKDAASVPFEQALLAREIPSHGKQKHTPGQYYFATTQRHVWCESYLEMRWLTLLDFDSRVKDVSSQPMRLNGPIGSGWLDHVPDFFARVTDGRGCLVDVKDPRRADDESVVQQRELTQLACDRVGWEYLFLTEPEPQRWTNVEWLSGFRRPLLAGTEFVEPLLQLAAGAPELGALCGFVGPEALVQPVLFHLCWQQRLMFDLDTPLRDYTKVFKGPNHE